MRERQPAGLKILFFAELWERFGFYTIQSLLVLYLVQALNFTDIHSYSLFSAFSALIYATPVIGGYLADKLIGFRKAILLGSILYIIGYLSLVFPNDFFFYPALAFLIWGNGFFKSCVSSFLGTLYKEHDPRRDSGFTIFYMGINIGSLLAPLITPLIKIKFGWGYAFATAGLGLIICLMTCLFTFNKYFGDCGKPPSLQLLHKKIFNFFTLEYLFYLSVIVVVFLTGIALNYAELVNYGLIIFAILTLLYLFISSSHYSRDQRNKLWALVILIIFSIIFWSFYMQTFLSLTLFIERNVDRYIFHWVVPTAMFQSIVPFFIITLSPFFAALWIKLAKFKKDPSIPTKFALGIFFIGTGFLTISLGIHLTVSPFISVIWIILLFILQTSGELSLSPVGLSAVTELAPKDITGTMMGVWFLAISAAYAIAGKIANLTAIPKNIVDPLITKAIYAHNFFYFGIAAIFTAILLFRLTPLLKRMM